MKKTPIEVQHKDITIVFDSIVEFAKNLGVATTRALRLLDGRTKISEDELKEILLQTYQLPKVGMASGNKNALRKQKEA